MLRASARSAAWALSRKNENPGSVEAQAVGSHNFVRLLPAWRSPIAALQLNRDMMNFKPLRKLMADPLQQRVIQFAVRLHQMRRQRRLIRAHPPNVQIMDRCHAW